MPARLAAERGRQTVELDGLVLVGRFAVVRNLGDDGIMKSLVVKCRRFDGETFERSALFFAFDRDTGEQLPLAQDVKVLNEGEPIAIHCKTKVSRSSGNAYLEAFKVTILPAPVVVAADAAA